MAEVKYTIVEEGGVTRGHIKSIVVDAVADIQNLPDDIPSGSDVLVLATSQVFYKSNENEWVEL